MKKKILLIISILVLFAAVVTGYFYVETTLVGPEVTMKATSNHDSVRIDFSTVPHDAQIDYDKSYVRLMLSDEVVAEEKVITDAGIFDFDTLQFGNAYIVEVNLVYNHKFYSGEHSYSKKIKVTPDFKEQFSFAPVENENYAPMQLTSLKEGGFLYASSVQSQFDQEVVLKKYDDSGQEIWSNTITEKYAQLVNVIELENGNILVSFNCYSEAYKQGVTLYSKDGVLLEHVTSDQWTNFPKSLDDGHSYLVQAGNDFVFTRNTELELHFLSMNSSYSVTQDQLLLTSNDVNGARFGQNRVFEYIDEDYLVVLNVYTSDIDKYVIILRVDSNGKIIWSYHIEDELHTSFKDITVDSENGDIYFVGDHGKATSSSGYITVNNKGFMLKIDSMGKKVWSNNFEEWGLTLFDTIDLVQDKLVVAGATYDYNTNEDVSYLIFDQDGKLEKSKAFLTGVYHDIAFTDSGIIVGSVVANKQRIKKFD